MRRHRVRGWVAAGGSCRRSGDRAHARSETATHRAPMLGGCELGSERQEKDAHARGAVTTVLIVEGATRELRRLWVLGKEETEALAGLEETGKEEEGEGCGSWIIARVGWEEPCAGHEGENMARETGEEH